MTPRFLWDPRPGQNIQHIARHGMTTQLWEEVFHHASRHGTDKDDDTIHVAEGRIRGQRYRIIYAITDDGTILPLTILPITGFPIERRGLR